MKYVIRVLKKEKTRLEEKFDLGLSDFAALTYEKQIKELQQAIEQLHGKIIFEGELEHEDIDGEYYIHDKNGEVATLKLPADKKYQIEHRQKLRILQINK